MAVTWLPGPVPTGRRERPDDAPTGERARDFDVGSALSGFRHGPRDPTTQLTRVGRGATGAGRFVRATFTPDGPGTIEIAWTADRPIDATAWGPGRAWLLDRVEAMSGHDDPAAPELERCGHPVVATAAREHRTMRFGASHDLYHELLPNIIEQRITAREAVRQWRTLCLELGDLAPGPVEGLRLPPAPHVLAHTPSWWFHPRGIERKRAQTLIEVARHASKMWAWAEAGPDVVAEKLRLIRGVGVWTVGSVLSPALGDADAVPVGDYHIKNTVSWGLVGEPRGTDERMLQLLQPFAGQRGRVIRLLGAAGFAAPKFGPRQRILPMARW
ncbi:MAG: DNA-3-methyladenine glycosylase 2 family protein [Actinomycetota bacterium]